MTDSRIPGHIHPVAVDAALTEIGMSIKEIRHLIGAADQLEYAVEYNALDDGGEVGLCGDGQWWPDEALARAYMEEEQRLFPAIHYRLIARRVSPTWEVTK